MLNKVTLIGRLGADPEIRTMTNGNLVANFNIATTENWKDKQTGERAERTEWVKIIVFGKLANIVESYVRKSSLLYLEGKLQTRKWRDKADNERHTTEVVIDMGGKLIMLDTKNNKKDTLKTSHQVIHKSLSDDIPF